MININGDDGKTTNCCLYNATKPTMYIIWFYDGGRKWKTFLERKIMNGVSHENLKFT